MEKKKKLKDKSQIFGYSKMRWKRSVVLYFFLIPAIACWVLFRYVPLYGLVMAFQNYSPVKGFSGSDWVGLKHFKTFFQSMYFGRLIKNTFLLSFWSLAWGFPIPIVLAILFNELRFKKTRNIFQTISYLPYFLSTVVVCNFVFNFLAIDTGIINVILERIGLEQHNFMNDPKAFRSIYVISGLWQSIGWNSIVYYAALSGVDPSLLEAAEMDGCGRFKKIWHISLPAIKTTIITLLLLEVGKLLSVGYEKVFLLYSESVYSVADVFSTYTYRRAFTNNQYSFSAAVGLFENLVRLALTVIANRVSKKVTGESLW